MVSGALGTQGTREGGSRWKVTGSTLWAFSENTRNSAGNTGRTYSFRAPSAFRFLLSDGPGVGTAQLVGLTLGGRSPETLAPSHHLRKVWAGRGGLLTAQHPAAHGGVEPLPTSPPPMGALIQHQP